MSSEVIEGRGEKLVKQGLNQPFLQNVSSVNGNREDKNNNCSGIADNRLNV